MTTQQTVLQSAIANAKTRAEVAALYSMIPPLRSSSALKAVYGVPSISDPFSSAVRPCESDIESAQKLLIDEQKAGKNPTGIEIEGLGQFSESALAVLKRFCVIAQMYHKVTSEAKWLSQMKFSPGEVVHSATSPY